MTIGSLITNIHNELLEEEIDENGSNFSMAEFEAEVFNSKYTFLVDSGSEITAMDDRIFEKIKNQTTETIPQLPVLGISVIGVTGVRSKRVTRQIMLQLTINKHKINVPFLVIPGLNMGAIMGNNFLNNFKAELNYYTPVSYTHLDVYKRQV